MTIVPDLFAPGIHRFENVLPSGWSRNMIVVDLPGGGTLVHSPTWLGEGTFEAVAALGEPTILLAPNHFHHLSLQRFRARFPSAKVVAATGAIPRLKKQGHDGIADVATVASMLPEGARFLAAEGVKTGEVFVSLRLPEGRAWIVCDAFFDVKREVKGLLGLGLRALGVVPGLRVSRTYKLLAVKDARAYVAWLRARLDEEKPTALFVSHGEPARGEDLPARLLAMTTERIA